MSVPARGLEEQEQEVADQGGQEQDQHAEERSESFSGLSVAPLFPGGGNTLTRASVSIASMMAVAFLGTMTLG